LSLTANRTAPGEVVGPSADLTHKMTCENAGKFYSLIN